MLNLIANYRPPAEISAVAGIPTDWQRSGYNVRSRSLPLLRDLAEALDSRFLLVSYNDEGFIAPAEMRAMLGRLGTVDVNRNAIQRVPRQPELRSAPDSCHRAAVPRRKALMPSAAETIALAI